MAKKKNIEEKNVEKVEKKETVKKEKEKKTTNKKTDDNKKSLFVRFRIFCHGVKSEFQKIHWPSKYDLVKYSLATIFFVVILSLFFYCITTVFELILKLFA